MDELHRHLAQQIRRLAAEKGLPLTHLADFSGRSRSHFWNVLSGANSPTLSWLDSVARALDVSVGELIGDPGLVGKVIEQIRRLPSSRLQALHNALRKETSS